MISLLRWFSSPSLKRFRCLSNSSSSIHSFQFSTHLSNNNESRSKNLDRIADELLSLSKLERYDYSILFRLKLGFQNYGPMDSAPSAAESLAAAAAASPAESAKAEEKKSFDVKIEKFEAAAKIKIIKEVRSFTDLGLKEAKDLVEKAPVVVKKGLTKEEAGAIMEKLKELGATVVLE